MIIITIAEDVLWLRMQDIDVYSPMHVLFCLQTARSTSMEDATIATHSVRLVRVDAATEERVSPVHTWSSVTSLSAVNSAWLQSCCYSGVSFLSRHSSAWVGANTTMPLFVCLFCIYCILYITNQLSGVSKWSFKFLSFFSFCLTINPKHQSKTYLIYNYLKQMKCRGSLHRKSWS